MTAVADRPASRRSPSSPRARVDRRPSAPSRWPWCGGWARPTTCAARARPGCWTAWPARHGGRARSAGRRRLGGPLRPQRSGWLGLALQRALAAGDLETASFCQRALAQTRARAGFADWALATLARPPLRERATTPRPGSSAPSPGPPWAQSRSGARPLAELPEVARAEGARGLGRAVDPHRLAGPGPRSRRPTCRPPTRSPPACPSAATASGSRRAARSARPPCCRRWRRRWPAAARFDAADSLLAFGETLERAGLRPRAALLYRRAPSWPPTGRGSSRRWPAPTTSGRTRPPVISALARARALDPNNPARAPRPACVASPRRASPGRRPPPPRPIPAPAPPPRCWSTRPVFLARQAQEPARKGEVEGRLLHRLYAETLHEDRRVSRVFHMAYEVVVEPRTQAELLDSFNVAGTPEILRAVVHRPGGVVEPALEQRIDRGQARMRWRELKAGDVAEFAVRSWTDRPGRPARRLPPPGFLLRGLHPQRADPVQRGGAGVSRPARRWPSTCCTASRTAPATRPRRAGARCASSGTARPTWPTSRWRPPPPRCCPRWSGRSTPTGTTSWRWFRDATAGFTEPDEQVRRLARELTAGKRPATRRCRPCSATSPTGSATSTTSRPSSGCPTGPQQVLARRQGDCDDKSTLLISLLKACGIEASLVFVQPRDTHRMPSLLSARGRSPALLRARHLHPAGRRG